ncbi:MAG TPA: hypothetical protein VFX24_09290 [Ktedonobacterales bacterium]|jgi:hypothetical protein|nr:hypothetical protein [Ktedonobacterales bacterium]
MMQPTHHEYHEYHAPSTHNGAAILSLVCAILWPLTLAAILYVNSVANTSGPGSTALPAPEPLSTLLQCGFTILPIGGIIAGGVGLYRAIRQPLLRKSLWLALTGLLLSFLWLVGIFLLSSAGAALVYWIQHL